MEKEIIEQAEKAFEKKEKEIEVEQHEMDFDKPTKRGRKKRQSNPENAVERLANALEKANDKHYPTLEELDAMPLKTHQDYLKYNDAVRARRKAIRKKDAEYLYAPMDKVKTVKVKITRTSNRGLPININLRKLDRAVWFTSPKGGFKDGEIIEMPACLVDEVSEISEPKYKQVIYPDGSHETVIDYWDNKYNAQIIMGDNYG